MLVAIDVGNTQTVVGLFIRDELQHHWRTATNAERTSDEYALLLHQFLALADTDLRSLGGVAISSVVPRVTAALREMGDGYLNAPVLVIEPGIKTGMPILYDNPREVGADRIANAVAAFERFGGPAIVVDFGTATTVDAVSVNGEYLGGAIVPGIEISLDALFGRAAALRRVELVAPKHVIGKSTVESIQAGAVYGFSGQVDAIVDRFGAELGSTTVIATGGLAGLLLPYSRTIEHHEPWLTLEGLRIVFDRNAADFD